MLKINGEHLTFEEIISVARFGELVTLSESAVEKIKKSREYVDKLVNENRTVYGITTGFGKFSDVRISTDKIEDLQENLIKSHACGTGSHFQKEYVRTIMLLRINALSIGFSGIRLETLQALVNLLNHDITPVIPEKGSLGASGDLAPLAHMTLPLLGLGEAYYKNEKVDSIYALQKEGLKPIRLTSKEGLAFINGTQVLTGCGVIATFDACNLLKLADIAAAMTIESMQGITDAFLPELHKIRPHKGQMDTAKNLLMLLEGSERTTKQGELRVQDAYSLRCVPQIHGASKDAVAFIVNKLNIEINSVTDNPIILPDMDLALSGGNFHGQPIALPLDFLGIAMAEIADVSERRIERMVNPQLSGLPAFLTTHGGLNSGFMIAQYAAAALVSENKVLAHPASVDSIPSSANQEDHVSMGTIAARKARDIVDNASRVIAIELVAAAQAMDLSSVSHKRAGLGTQAAYKAIRDIIPMVKEDRILYKDFDKALELVKSGDIVRAVEKALNRSLEL